MMLAWHALDLRLMVDRYQTDGAVVTAGKLVRLTGSASELNTGDMVEVNGTTGIVLRIQAVDEPGMAEERSGKQSVA